MENYSYSDNIKPPSQLGVSDKGNLDALGNDIKALQGYVDVLVSGNSKAQRGGSPMGNKYFFDTGTECKDMTGVSQARFAYINNVPDGWTGIGKGLVPGIIENISYINPGAIFSAFGKDTTCQQITMETRGSNNEGGSESRYVTQADIETYNPCWFPNRKNPITGAKCTEGMQTLHYPKDPAVRLYAAGVGALLLYMVVRAIRK